MNARMMTSQQIRVAGLAALSRELGLVGMIRFMQQSEVLFFSWYPRTNKTASINPLGDIIWTHSPSVSHRSRPSG